MRHGTRGRAWVCAAAWLTLGPALAWAQTGSPEVRSAAWSGWSAYWENDSFTQFGGSDDAFTNGLRLVLGRAPDRNLPGTDWLGRLLSDDPNPRLGSSLVVGQNFFTPREITDYDVDPTDRPYAGYTYVGVRYDVTARPRLDIDPNTFATRRNPFQLQRQQSVEVDLGVLGQGAGARKVQASVHSVFSTHRIPKGWSHQIRNSPVVSLLYMSRWRIGWHFFDVTPHYGALLGLLGTSQTYPFAGLTARVGYRMSGFPTLVGRNTAAPDTARSRFEAGLMGGVEGRFMAWNPFVEGSPLYDEPGVEAHRWMGDYRLGVYVRVEDWRADYLFHVRRSPEVAEEGPSLDVYDNYGSFSVTYEPDERVESVLEGFAAKIFDGFYLEAGFGSEARVDEREPGVVMTHAMHAAVGRRVWGPFEAGYELVGVGREFGPPEAPGGDHTDRFVVQSAFTLRVRPTFGSHDQFDVHLRGGVGLGKDELEVTPASPGSRAGPCPAGTALDPGEGPDEKSFCTAIETERSYLVGGGATWRPGGRALGVSVDVAHGWMGDAERRRFTAWTVGFRWTP